MVCVQPARSTGGHESTPERWGRKRGGDLSTLDVVRCVQDVYGARLSHKEDQDLFEMHIKACFSMTCAARGAK